jgi:lipooligosaccharide transport system ATP-binding protein
LQVVNAATELPLVHARGLVKRFGDLTAVDAIDFDVQQGEAFGFLGPNGAGKSSTMRMIGCVSPLTDGTLRVLDLDPVADGPEIRGHLGVVPQEDNLDTELSVFDNLILYGRYFGIPRSVLRDRARELLDFVQLGDRADSKVDPLSGGMKRRLTIARALVNEPDLLLLDEPTTGLDPQARHLVWERLWRLKQDGVTQVLTTHYMDEAERLCDRLVIMDGGRIVDEGSPATLVARHVTREVVEVRPNMMGAGGDLDPDAGDVEAELEAVLDLVRANGERAEVVTDRVLAYTDDGDALVGKLNADGLRPASVLVRRSTLEDVFLILTGRSLIEG